MRILGIESSCDETAAAVVEFSNNSKSILSNEVASQNEIHKRFGGVVPELASRSHLEASIPIIKIALKKAKTDLKNIDGIAVTHAPGLLGSLLVGLQTAKGLAFAADKPLIGVNHLEGHLNAITLEKQDMPYPHIGLVVSGGHTSLYLVKKFGDYTLLGATRDDAAGEAFDKVAKLLDLGYPGGPIIDKLAQKGDPDRFKFNPPRFGGYSHKSQPDSLDFSFSGMKTAVLLKVREEKSTGKLSDSFIYDLIAGFQKSAVTFICDRIIQAAKKHKTSAVTISGGVAANTCLRKTLNEYCDENNIKCFIPSFQLCTDNAAMIANVGGSYLKIGKRSDINLNAIANMEIGL